MSIADVGRNLSVATEERNGDLHLRLTGHIDESSELEQFAEGTRRSCVFHLGNIKFINSVGVRRWLLMMRRFEEQDVSVRICECPLVIIHQMNSIDGFACGADVESFFAPYECDNCGFDGELLLRVQDHRDSLCRLEAPTLECPDCGSAVAMSAPEDRYLSFLEPE